LDWSRFQNMRSAVRDLLRACHPYWVNGPTEPTTPTLRTKTRPPVFPICPWNRKEDSIGIDTDDLGSSFFVSGDGGVFVTARHVVENYIDDPSVLRILHVDDPPTRFLELQVTELQVHPDFDLAIGRVHLPPALYVQHLILGTAQLAPGEVVYTFGYSRTVSTNLGPREVGRLPGLHLSMNPQFYGGTISDFHPTGFSFTRGPVYVHTAETMGGDSGGPMLRLADSGVYGITSRGSELHGTATDIRAVLDWPVSFLDRKTLRQLAQESGS
jgi:hypothetical protein